MFVAQSVQSVTDISLHPLRNQCHCHQGSMRVDMFIEVSCSCRLCFHVYRVTSVFSAFCKPHVCLYSIILVHCFALDTFFLFSWTLFSAVVYYPLCVCVWVHTACCELAYATEVVVFTVFTLCGVVSLFEHFRGMCCLHHQDSRIWFGWMLKCLGGGNFVGHHEDGGSTFLWNIRTNSSHYMG